MRGEPVLPSIFVSLFESSLPKDVNTQQVRKNFIVYHELDHHCEKFDESLVDFNRRLTQSVTDVRELLNGTYARYANFEKLPQLIDVEGTDGAEDLPPPASDQTTVGDILDQSTTENEHLPPPLAPDVVLQRANTDA